MDRRRLGESKVQSKAMWDDERPTTWHGQGVTPTAAEEVEEQSMREYLVQQMRRYAQYRATDIVYLDIPFYEASLHRVYPESVVHSLDLLLG